MYAVQGKRVEMTVLHPTADDVGVDDINELVAHGIRTTPHVGNMDKVSDPYHDEQCVAPGIQNVPRPADWYRTRSYLTLGLLGVKIECVDTNSVADDEFRPDVLLKGEREIPLTNIPITERRTRVPGSVTIEGGHASLMDVHMEALQAVVPGATTRTMFYNQLGTDYDFSDGEIYHALMLAVDGRVRRAEHGIVSSASEERIDTSEVEQYGLFGAGDDPLSGLMPPLAMAMAAELVEASLEGRSHMHHIGGTDMPHYTKQAALMTEVVRIAEKTMDSLGISPPANFRYYIYEKYYGIRGLAALSRQVGNMIGLTHYSQHDLSERYDLLEEARNLIEPHEYATV